MAISLSVVPYVAGIGFYSDDWAFLGVLVTSEDQSLGDLWIRHYTMITGPQMRPTQVTLQVLLYRLFGLQPFGYHLVNAALLAIMVILLYWVLRELRVPRLVAVAVPAVFGLLPSYATNRFWFAAFSYALSITLFLLSLYADLRAVSGSPRVALAWKVLALLALSAAAFGYEVVVPHLLLAPILVWRHATHAGGSALLQRWGRARSLLFVGSNIALLSAVLLYKSKTAHGLWVPDAFHLVRLVIGPLLVHFGSYGVGLPQAAWWSLAYLDLAAVVAAVVLGLLVVGYLVLTARWSPHSLPTSFPWPQLAAAGAGLFVLGYAVFIITGRVDFTSTGIANRTGMAASGGAAFVLVAAVGWVTAGLRRERWRVHAFSGLVAAICVAGSLVTSGLASFWVAAWSEQQAVVADIQRTMPDLPKDATLILHGICPYHGPTTVFATHWDLAGALQVAYRQPNVRADVTADLIVEPAGLATSLYGAKTAFHPYGPRLLLFDYRHRQVLPLPDAETALRAFGTANPGSPAGCEHGSAGRGVTLLPFDRLYDTLQSKGFRPWR